MGDLIFRRGKVQGIDAVKGRTTVRAFVPETELYKYSAHSAPLHMGERTICEPWRGTGPPPITSRRRFGRRRQRKMRSSRGSVNSLRAGQTRPLRTLTSE